MATGTKTGGRSRGTPNKTTGQLKDMILGALDKAGGMNYLHQQSVDNPVAFMTLVGKVLPLTVAGDPNNPVSLVSKIEVELVGPKTASR